MPQEEWDIGWVPWLSIMGMVVVVVGAAALS